jgi:hypothetical protein
MKWNLHIWTKYTGQFPPATVQLAIGIAPQINKVKLNVDAVVLEQGSRGVVATIFRDEYMAGP